jgi:hypothetical protein
MLPDSCSREGALAADLLLLRCGLIDFDLQFLRSVGPNPLPLRLLLLHTAKGV